MKYTMLLAMGALVSINAGALAQYGYGYPYGGYGYGGYGGFGGAGTAFSANSMGMASLIQATGQYQKNHVEASVQWDDEVRKLSAERLEQRNAYLDMMQKKAIADGQANRERLDARKQAALARKNSDQYPDALKPSEFDAETGKINWPVLLQRNMFDESRTVVESQVSQWLASKKSGQAFDIYGVHASVDAVRTVLKTLIQSVPTGEYLSSRNFLDRLDQTIQLSGAAPPPVAGN